MKAGKLPDGGLFAVYIFLVALAWRLEFFGFMSCRRNLRKSTMCPCIMTFIEEIQPGFKNWVNAWSLSDCRVPFWGIVGSQKHLEQHIRKREHFGNRAPWAKAFCIFWPPSIGAGMSNCGVLMTGG